MFSQRLRAVLRYAPVLLLVVGTLLVHDVRYLLRHPFWLDEAWVAVSTRAPLGRLPLLTSSTPIGWTWLLRLVPGRGLQRYRLVPLAFSAAAAVLAYCVGRRSGPMPAVSGMLAGAAVLFLPSLLIRNDLKQYSADAAVALLILLLLARLDAEWSRQRLLQLCGTVVICALFSHAALLVGSAGVLALALTSLSRRRRSRLKASVAAVVTTGLGLLAVFLVFDAPTQNRVLTAYWSRYYLPVDHGPVGAWTFLRERATAVSPLLGVRSPLVALLLILLGLVTLAASGRWISAGTPVVLLGELACLSALRRYPFLDVRTSTFLLVVLVVVMAVGVGGVIAFLVRRGRRAAGAAVGIVLAVAYLRAATPYVRSHTLSQEDVRSQVQYVEAHWRAGDVVLVNSAANWGFGYYASRRPQFEKSSAVATGFVVTYPAAVRVLTLRGRERPDVLSGFTTARALQAGRPGARLWIVRTHMFSPEAAVWGEVLGRLPVVTVPCGPEPLLALDSFSPGRRSPRGSDRSG